MKRRGMGPVTWACIALLAGFVVADSVAAASGHAHGETFSHWATRTVRSLPTPLRVIARVLILGFALSLGPHLAFGTPLLP